jgi:hypothetical protein
MKNKETLKIKLLTEKLEKLSGKKVVIEEGKYSSQLLATGINFDTDLEFISADHRDICGLADSFANSLSKFGAYCYEDPSLEGSDTFGFIISKKPLSKKQINWAAKALFEESKTYNKKVIKEKEDEYNLKQSRALPALQNALPKLQKYLSPEGFEIVKKFAQGSQGINRGWYLSKLVSLFTGDISSINRGDLRSYGNSSLLGLLETGDLTQTERGVIIPAKRAKENKNLVSAAFANEILDIIDSYKKQGLSQEEINSMLKQVIK